MRPHAIFFVMSLLALLGAASAFVPSQYLYAGEENISISYTNFTLNNNDYSIVYYGSAPTFMLRGGEIVNGTTEVYSALHAYYLREYYPTESEISQIRYLIDSYQKSRNDGFGSAKGNEEYACRSALLTDKKIEVYINKTKIKLWCYDDYSCEINAKLIFQAYGENIGLGSYTDVLQPLKDFAYSSYGTDTIMGNLIAKWNNTNEENIIETINYTKNIIPTLDSYADKMEASIFRLPRSNDSADKADCRAKKCYAICPPMDISQETTLAELGTKVSALSTRIQPLAGCSETSSQISRRTQERELYFYNTVTSQHYEAVFSPMEKNGLALESKAADLYKHVANISLVSISNQARDMREDIRESITNNSFEGIDDKITAYNKKLFVFEDSVNGMDALYNNTLNAKYELSALVFELGTEELPPANVEKYEELKAREDALDGSFVDGLTPEQVYSLLENYTIAINDAKGLLQSASINPTSTTVDKFRSFAMKMSAGTTSLIKNSNLIEAESIPQNKTLLLGGFSLVVFLSVASIFFLAFLYMIGIRTIGQLKYPLTAAFAIVIVSAALFSILLFFFMDKTATDATMDEFMSDFSSRHSIALVAKVDTATSDLQKGSVKDCANSLMSAILSNRTLNKTVDFYYIESAGDSCTKNGSPLAVNCTSDIEKHDSVIVLSPSMATEKPSFSTVFTSRAEIKGTSDYFESCPLALTFK